MTTKLKQLFFIYVTTPIAKILEFINVDKYNKIKERRKILSEMNKMDYIIQISKILFDADIQKYINENKVILPHIFNYLLDKNIDKAYEMFYQKKQRGYFDELNLLIK